MHALAGEAHLSVSVYRPISRPMLLAGWLGRDLICPVCAGWLAGWLAGQRFDLPSLCWLAGWLAGWLGRQLVAGGGTVVLALGLLLIHM
jgi:hypothetical protein